MDHLSQSLQQACSQPDFLFENSADDFVRLVYKEFAQDIDRLKRAYSVRASHWNPPSSPSPSYILYREEFDEVNRTLVGLLALRWIHQEDYDAFVRCQPPEVRLTRASFDWICSFYKHVILNSNDLYVLITSIVINDLGKDPQLASDYFNLTGEDISDLNHDAILLKACESGLVNSLAHLPPCDKDDILRGMQLSASFNFGQLAQAENVPACLSGLEQMKGHRRSFHLQFMEQLLDIAGAAGHMDWTCAKKLIQIIFEAYRNVFDACEGVIAGTLDLRAGYDLVLIRRAQLLHRRDFRLLDVVGNREDRAMVRVLCMGGVQDLKNARLYETAWRSLEDQTREALVYALNIDGSNTEPAIQPTYMPALISRAKDENSLVCVLRYMARVMSPTDTVEASTVVLERNVLGVLKRHVESGEFDQDPTILETVDVPRAVVALTV